MNVSDIFLSFYFLSFECRGDLFAIDKSGVAAIFFIKQENEQVDQRLCGFHEACQGDRMEWCAVSE